jgi:hypothetical protein
MTHKYVMPKPQLNHSHAPSLCPAPQLKGHEKRGTREGPEIPYELNFTDENSVLRSPKQPTVFLLASTLYFVLTYASYEFFDAASGFWLRRNLETV